MTERSTGRAVIVTAVLLTVLLPAVDLATGGVRHLFDPLASDAYYYFTVGQNVARLGRVSFDGVLPTNGFHPVWQIIVALAFFVGRSLSDLSVVGVLLAIELAMLGGAVLLVGRALERGEGRLTTLYATIPVGAYALAMTPLWIRAHDAFTPGVYGTMWSYCNGMESACVLLAYGIVSLRFLSGHARTTRAAALDGLALSLLVLSRLDTAFVAAALVGVMALESWREQAARTRVLVTAATLALPIFVYLVVNKLYCGSAMPVSGWLKSSYPFVNRGNVERLLVSLAHPWSQTLYRMYRLGQLVLPSALAIVQLGFVAWRLVKQRATRVDTWLAATGLGMLATSIYDLCFVELWDHGSWYSPVGTLFFSVCVVVHLSRVRWRRPTIVRLGALVVIGIASTVYFVELSRGTNSNAAWADFYQLEAPRVRAFYDEVGKREGQPPRFVEVDDGIFSFATGYHAISGKGFSLDVEGARALKRGQLTSLSVARGYNRVTSVMYMDARGLGPATDNDRACLLISGITPKALCSLYRFTIEYARDKFAVVRVDPR